MREPPGLSRTDNKRPDGLTLFPYKEGKSMIWDFTCSSTLAPSHVASTSLGAGKSAEQAATKKHTIYQELKTQYHFVPVALETFGSWGKEGLKFIKDLGSRIGELSGEKRSTNFLFQAISMANQRGNAISIAGTVPNAKKLEEFYYLSIIDAYGHPFL